MKQNAFFDRLRQELKGLPRAAVDEIIADYREYIGDALAAGRNEDEVVAALGDPAKLARELKAQANYRQWEQRRSFGNLMRLVASVAGLGLLQLLLLGPFLLYLLFLTIGYIVSSALTVAGLVALVAFGSHHLLGYPPSMTSFSVFDDDRQASEANSAADTLASGAIPAIPAPPPIGDHTGRGNAHINFGGLQIKGERFIMHLRDGSHVEIVTHAGPLDVRRDEQGALSIETPAEAARDLLTQNADGSLSIDRSEIVALDLHNGKDGHLSMARTGKDPQDMVWDFHGDDGSHVSFEQTVKGETKQFSAGDKDDTVSINGGQINIDSGHDHVHISGLGGQSIESIALRYSVVALPIGLLGLLLCIWLTRITWRALVHYSKRQIDALSTRFNDSSDS